MFANEINNEGHPICMCGEPVLPNSELPEESGQRGGLVSGTKGLVILHQACIEAHNAEVLRS